MDSISCRLTLSIIFEAAIVANADTLLYTAMIAINLYIFDCMYHNAYKLLD